MDELTRQIELLEAKSDSLRRSLLTAVGVVIFTGLVIFLAVKFLGDWGFLIAGIVGLLLALNTDRFNGVKKFKQEIHKLEIERELS